MSSVPLTQAVTSGDAAAVKAVLANGADANERTGGGQTPLILATIFGHTHLIPLLLDAGADPQLRDNLGLNAFDWAQRRGATEAIEVLSNKTRPKSSTKVETRPAGPAREKPPVEPAIDKPETISEEERSRRWIAGLKQRIAEQSQREVPDAPNIFRARPEPPPPAGSKLPPPFVSSQREPQPEQPAPPPRKWQGQFIAAQREPLPETPAPAPPQPRPEIPAPPPDPRPEMPAQPPGPQPESPGESEPDVKSVAAQAEAEVPRSSGRKRCPKCNAIYNSDLVAYCAHHIVPLVDADAPPIISEPQKTSSPVLFWTIIAITLTGSIVVGSLLSSYFYNSDTPAPQVAASPPPAAAVQKGTPAVGRELEGKVVSLPVAECPLNGQEAIPGTVVVRVSIGKNGQVKEARASGGDWLLRGAATEAAMKSTFAPEKLRGRDTEGTITYTFEP